VLPADEWPLPTAHEFSHRFELAGPELTGLLDAVAYAISTEETRYYLNGVFLHIAEGRLRAIATDGHRMAMHSLPLPEGADGLPGVIVPRKAIGLILKLADHAVEPVAVSLSDRRVKLEFDGLTIDSKTIDGSFPDYTRVIPQANDKRARCDPAGLLAAVKRVTAVSTEKTRAVKMACAKDRILLEVSSPENGHAREDLPADFSGEPVEIGFNRQYLADILTRATSDTIDIVLADGAAPTLFNDPKRPDLVQVLMPMRV
jgi:DNA polymerase-3 subunit beta